MIILYNPESSDNHKPILPLSLLAIGAVLEQNNINFQIVDGNLTESPLKDLKHLIQKTNARILGMTIMPGPQLSQAVPLCKTLKTMCPDLKIVWGGYFPTQHFQVCLNSDYVDFVIKGHGELVFPQLIDSIINEQGYEYIPGIAYRDPVTRQLISNPRGDIPNPEHHPPFPYHKLEMPRYIRNTTLGSRTLSHHSSYGCPFLCNFCAVVNMVNGKWLPQSAQTVAGTVQYLKQMWNINAIEFFDNNFFTHALRVHQFAEQIKKLEIAWWGEGRIDTLLGYRPQTWKLMKESGLKMIFLGAESGDNQTLKMMNKGGTLSVDQTFELAETMRHYEIIPEFSFVLGNPPDPETDILNTIEFVRRLKKVNPHAEIILYPYTPVPLAGNLYEQVQATGFSFPSTLEEWANPQWTDFSNRRNIHVDWVSDSIRRKTLNFQRVLNAFYPTSTDPHLTPTFRFLLKITSSWRYHFKFYYFPIELAFLQKMISYQRPETSGF